MKYAILGDIHSNLEAFNAVIIEAKENNVDRIICTGDLIGYGANPRECLHYLKNLPVEAYLRGNHEEAVLSDGIRMNSMARKAINYTKGKLLQEELSWIYNNSCWTYKILDRVAAAHGSYHRPWRFSYLSFEGYARSKCFEHMRDEEINVLFVGHTHMPSLMTNDLEVHEEIEYIDLDKFSPCIVDVGSVGQPRDDDPRASFSIYDSDENVVIRHRVDYDFVTASDKIIEAGLPVELAKRIRVGR